MIINLLFDMVYALMNLLLIFPISIPSFPEGMSDAIDYLIELVGEGMNILYAYFDMNYFLTLFAFVLAVDGALHVYRFVMFVLKKIPFLNVK